MEANGWAIVQGGRIDIRTVSAHARAAKVNWLVTTAQIMVFNHWSDEKIEQTWFKYSNISALQPRCVEVLITTKD